MCSAERFPVQHPPTPVTKYCICKCTLHSIKRVTGDWGACWFVLEIISFSIFTLCTVCDLIQNLRYSFTTPGQKPRRGGGLGTIISSRKVLSRLILRRRERRDFTLPSTVRVLSFYAVFQMNVPQME
jgi:hypothetical protein